LNTRPEPGFEAIIGDDPPVVLYAERLRDGRIALGVRTQGPDGSWSPGELHLLEPGVHLGLAAWLSPAVEDGWLETVRSRQAGPVRTAEELYGEGAGSVLRLALEMVREIPVALLGRAMLLLANSIGPEARERLVTRLNATESEAEEAALRRRLAEESEAFAFAVAAAALLDAVARGLAGSAEDEARA
jgi:hypothetical protein